MKLRLLKKRPALSGHTLVEFIISTSIVLLVLGGVIYTHMMGQTLHRWSMSKVGANDASRKGLIKMQEELQSAKIVNIGIIVDIAANGIVGAPALGQLQQGTAIQIHATTNLNAYVRYWLAPMSGGEPGRHALFKSKTGTPGYRIVAEHLTNNPAMFRFEDFRGETLTEISANALVAVTLDFRQFQYPITQVGSDYYYDYYRVQTRIARRTIE
ncbi:MAG: hypothetical protein ACI9OD_001245 [Limisphaerales bacterium]|jgi:hypothetical protein